MAQAKVLTSFASALSASDGESTLWSDFVEGKMRKSLHFGKGELFIVRLNEVLHLRPCHFDRVEFTVSHWEAYNLVASLFCYIIHMVLWMNWPVTLDNAPYFCFETLFGIGNSLRIKPFHHLLL